MTTEKATLGGGCFWCIEAAFQKLKGVESVVSGYAGGEVTNPTYEQVCSGVTGHAEVVQITYDPGVINFRTLLEVFFTIHDPTTLNRQGADVGTQYRSIILYHDENQKKEAQKIVSEIGEEGALLDPIVTEIKPLEIFYNAEVYHQDYYQQNPTNRYCSIVIPPKLNKLIEKFGGICK